MHWLWQNGLEFKICDKIQHTTIDWYECICILEQTKSTVLNVRKAMEGYVKRSDECIITF